MDWIERLFHVAPDAGSGSMEFGLMIAAGIAVAMGVVGFAARRYVQQRNARLRLRTTTPLGNKAPR